MVGGDYGAAMQTIQAAVMDRTDGVVVSHKITTESMQLEAPRAGEVLVRLTSCGVCGTDRGCIRGAESVSTPCVLGHEGVGIVEEIGSGVMQFAPGDRVVLGFPYCGVCRQCVRGQPHYCAKQKLVPYYPFAEINQAIDDCDNDTVIKPILKMAAW